MRFDVSGGGEREEALRRLLREGGHQVSFAPPWDAVILSLPFSALPEEKAPLLAPGQDVICGRTDPAFDALAARRGWKIHRVLKDAAYQESNALLSAEGAVYYAMNRLDFALSDARCLVVGYGRIGKALTGMLRGLGAQVTVAARRAESRREAGENSVSTQEMAGILPDQDVVFNTVPCRILGENELRHVKKDALLLEIASAPYGIDPDCARAMGLRLCLESGIPGRYCPRSAARLVMDYMEREGVLHA